MAHNSFVANKTKKWPTIQLNPKNTREKSSKKNFVSVRMAALPEPRNGQWKEKVQFESENHRYTITHAELALGNNFNRYKAKYRRKMRIS